MGLCVRLGPYMPINVGLGSIGEYREVTTGAIVRLFWSDWGFFPTLPDSNIRNLVGFHLLGGISWL